jgi:hypothetical protein
MNPPHQTLFRHCHNYLRDQNAQSLIAPRSAAGEYWSHVFLSSLIAKQADAAWRRDFDRFVDDGLARVKVPGLGVAMIRKDIEKACPQQPWRKSSF